MVSCPAQGTEEDMASLFLEPGWQSGVRKEGPSRGEEKRGQSETDPQSLGDGIFPGSLRKAQTEENYQCT